MTFGRMTKGFFAVGLFIGMQSTAFASDRDLIMDEGSVISQSIDLVFGLSREKRFCDGIEVGFFRSLLRTTCCTIRVNSIFVPDADHVTLTAQERQIRYTDDQVSYAAIEAGALTTIRCGNSAPSANALEAAFGSLFKVKTIVPTTKAVPSMSKKIKFEGTEVQPKQYGI